MHFCQLSVKNSLTSFQQALSYDPFNPQLLRTQAFWAAELTSFKALASSGLTTILSHVPREMEHNDAVLSRTQAILKGMLERRGMNLGVGNRKDITRRMTARIGVLLESRKGGGATSKHPVMLTVRPAWSGLITNIRVFDLENNHLGAIPLKTPFAPIKETGLPRKLTLSLSCRRIVLQVRVGSKDVCGFESDGEEGTPPLEHGPQVTTEEVTELKFTFTDESTGQYTCRRMKLNLDDLIHAADVPSAGNAIREFTTAEYGGATVAESGENAVYNQKAVSADVGSADLTVFVATDSHAATMTTAAAASTKSVIKRLSVQDDSAAPTVTETNIECVEVLRQGLQYKGKYYMVRIVNEIDVTQVTVLPVHSDRVFVFMMTREHIDRTHSLFKRLVELFLILESNDLVNPLFSGRHGLAAEEAAIIENPSICQAKHCFVHLHPQSQGATIILVHPGNLPMLGSGFEVMEGDLLIPEDGPVSRAPSVRLTGSVSRKSTRGLSVRGVSARGGSMFMSSRMRSTKSFRNNAIDEFLYGNMNPPAFLDDGEELDDEQDDFGRSVSYKGRAFGGGNALPTIHSEGTMYHTNDSGTVSAQDSFTEAVGFGDDDDDVAGRAVDMQAVDGECVTGAFMVPTLVVERRGSGDSLDEEGSGDELVLAPLPSIATKAVTRPSSTKLAKRPPRVPAAGVKAAARRGMTDGMTLEKALAAAAELQANFFSAASKKGHSVSWDEWEADKRDEDAVVQSALSAECAEDAGVDLSSQNDRMAVDFLEEGNEEEFLRQIVDVPWIEELGSIEVVEYVLQDVISIFVKTTVAIIAQQYGHLPIFAEFVADAIHQGSTNAGKIIAHRTEVDQNTALDLAVDVMTEEIIEEIVDELAEERINKLNLMAFKAAVAAEAAAVEAETKKAKVSRKPNSAVPAGKSPSISIGKEGTTPLPPSKTELIIIIPEPKNDVAPEHRTADVQFSQPYRAAPDSPEPPVPVKYNVQKIASKVIVSRHSSRPYSKRDTLVPVLGVNAVGKKRHTPDALLSAQTYHPPEYLGQQTPLNSVYTGTFSRFDAFPEGVDEVDIDADVKSRKLPSRQLHVLRLNTIKALPVIEVDAGGLNREVTEPTDLAKPSSRAQGLRRALNSWDGGGDGGDAGPIISISTITEASQQPFRNSFTVPGGRGHLALGFEDDGAVSIRSDNSGGSSPVFKNIQRRKLQLPVDEESVYSVGSSSRAGARRSPNKRTMLDANDQQDSGNELLSLAGSLGDQSFAASEMCSVRTSTGRMRRQLRTDPLRVPPRGHELAEKKRIARESLDDFKYIGYVKERPLVHSSHWRGKLFAYLSGLRNADHLRKHVAMLTKATKVALSPEEAVCALADTSGSVGEVADKLRNLEFYSELKLVCRSLHVRSMVCMLEGGERLFKDAPVDTFGDRGEFDDFSVFASEQLSKRAEGSSISRSLQHSRSVMAKGHKALKPTVFDLSKTAPLGSTDQPSTSYGDHPAIAPSARIGHATKSATAPPTSSLGRVSFSQGQDHSSGGPLSSPTPQLEDGLEEVGLLAKLFHFERDEPGTSFPEEDDNSSMTSLSMSLGSTTSFYADSFKYAPPYAVSTHPTVDEVSSFSPGKPHGLTRSNTAASTSSAGSGSVASHHTAASAADQAAASHLTPGIRSILSLPRQNTTMDLMAQSASVLSKATFVPLKFASTGGSKSRLDLFPSPKRSESGFADSPQPNATGAGLSPKWDSKPPEASRRDNVPTADPSLPVSSVAGARSSMLADQILASAAAGQLPADNDDESATGDSAPFRPSIRRNMPARRSSMGSFRLAGRIDDLLVEHGDVPLAVMCRRDFLKAQQDEVLLKSDKNYIRRPIEKKIGLLRSSIDSSFAAPIMEDI